MTNVVLNVLVLTVLVGVSWRVLPRLGASALVRTAVVLCVLTLVFDTLMIAADLYAYAPDKILGVHLWGAPLEDFAYPVAAAVGIPVLWTLLGDRRRTTRDRPGAAGAPPGSVPADQEPR